MLRADRIRINEKKERSYSITHPSHPLGTTSHEGTIYSHLFTPFWPSSRSRSLRKPQGWTTLQRGKLVKPECTTPHIAPSRPTPCKTCILADASILMTTFRVSEYVLRVSNVSSGKVRLLTRRYVFTWSESRVSVENFGCNSSTKKTHDVLGVVKSHLRDPAARGSTCLFGIFRRRYTIGYCNCCGSSLVGNPRARRHFCISCNCLLFFGFIFSIT